MAELADARDLKSLGYIHTGSTPVTNIKRTYPSGEGIRLISVNARGSIPLVRTSIKRSTREM